MRPKQKLEDTRKPIEDSKTYTIDGFMQDVGWGRHALKQARLQGLRVVKISGRCFIRGKDFSDFVGKQEAE